MSHQMIRSDICVVGDGVVGKAAALGLAQAGLSVTLLSAAKTPPNVGRTLSKEWDVRVFALNHVAHALLDSLKVWGALDASRIAPITGMEVKDAAEAVDGKLDFDAYGAYINELAWIVEDSNLNHALDAALGFAPNIQYVVGQAEKLVTDSSGAQIHLSDGRQVETQLIVGADGAQSWVRGQADIGLDYRSYGQQGVVTNFACEKPHHGIARQWFVEEQGIIALLPLPGNQVSLVWSAPDALAAELMAGTLDALTHRLAPYAASDLGQLTPLQPESIKSFPLRLIRPHSMVAERVALIGDAAHAVHPLAGHGMNLGFGDVQVLLKILSEREAHRDCGDSRLLSRYRRARSEEVALMQITTDGLARLFGSPFPAVRLARNVGMNLLNSLPVLKRKLISHAMGK
ncbi:FAD-dependent monooxygenase [Undibacterium seohonense]|uniref:FAD-dependent monooxygenase n=1 Tax=Undibacterium seohonense TaxID=1344950 RepID=A0ABR6X296_9BURK|nr:FAD-dependent monooxygenase [Undibacterium seohonense]MBC3807024.1 FAD-dependent monooxygenase [Undibacterium seohonense]